MHSLKCTELKYPNQNHLLFHVPLFVHKDYVAKKNLCAQETLLKKERTRASKRELKKETKREVEQNTLKCIT